MPQSRVRVFCVSSWTATFLNQACNSQKSSAADLTCSWSGLHHMTMMLSSGSSVISVVLIGKVQFMLEHGFLETLSPENTVQESFFFLLFNKNGRRAAAHRLRDEHLNSFFSYFPNVPWGSKELCQAARESVRLSAVRKSSQEIEKKLFVILTVNWFVGARIVVCLCVWASLVLVL